MKGFLSSLLISGLSPNTAENYVSRVATLMAKYGPIVSKSESIVSKIVLDETLKNNSKNIYLKALKWWGKYKDIDEFKRVKLLPRNGTAKATLSIDELRRFCAIVEPHGTRKSNIHRLNYDLFWKLCALTGARCGEVAQLRVKDFSFAEKLIYLNETKTHSPRKIPIPGSLLADIEAYCNQVKDYLFPGMVAQYWGRSFHYRIKKMGIERPNLTPHSIRHSVLTIMLQQPGVNIFDVMSLAGHKSSKTTQIYYHLDGERLKQVIKRHPLENNNCAEERARMICDVIRSFGLDYEPSQTVHKKGIQVSVLIRGSPTCGESKSQSARR